MLSEKCVIFAVESGSYMSKANQEVNYCRIHYFNVSDRSDSRLEKGYTILNKNVYPDFSVADFPQLPAVYNLEFRPDRNRQGKIAPKLTSVSLVSGFSIPQNADFILLLGAKKYNYQPEDSKPVNGIKFFGIDPLSYLEDSDFVGYKLLEASLSKGTFEQFSTLPGYYDLVFEQVRGRNGDATYKAQMVRFMAPLSLTNNDNNDSSSTPL